MEFQQASSVCPDRFARLHMSVNESSPSRELRRAALIEQFLDGEQGRFQVQRVERCFGQQQIYAAVNQRLRLLIVGQPSLHQT